MKMIHYAIMAALMVSLAACGVRRDLKLPDDDKQAAQAKQTGTQDNNAPAASAAPIE